MAVPSAGLLSFVQVKDFTIRDGNLLFANYDTGLVSVPVYLLTVFLVWWHMRDRKPYGLDGIVFLHNAFLCVWSLAMFVGIVVGVWERYEQHGARALFCDQDNAAYPSQHLTGTLGYWMYIYYISKYYELLDTVFATLRKKPLTFLHVYHHAIMAVFSYSWFYNYIEIAYSGAVLNTFIHVIMYYFYARKTIDKEWDPYWKRYLTTMQIAQFLLVFSYLILYTLAAIHGDYAAFFRAALNLDWDWHGRCHGNMMGYITSYWVDLTFLALFVNFFLQTYVNTRASSRRPDKSKRQ